MEQTAPTGRPQTVTAALLAAGMAVTVGTALAFEHIGGYIPCKLCLEQRLPYYIGIPIALVAFASGALRFPQTLTRLLILAVGLLMVWGAGLGIYHSGVEWGWWQGPADCGVVASSSGSGSLLEQLDATVPPACNEAAGRFLGLSFAGWNVVASVILAGIAFTGALKRS